MAQDTHYSSPSELRRRQRTPASGFGGERFKNLEGDLRLDSPNNKPLIGGAPECLQDQLRIVGELIEPQFQTDALIVRRFDKRVAVSLVHGVQTNRSALRVAPCE